MTNDDRERLKRIAFGPGATPQERGAAEESLRKLDEQDVATGSEPHGDPFVASVTFRDGGDKKSWHISTDPSNDISTDICADIGADMDADESLWRRRINVGWLIPIAAGAVLVGAVGALGFTSQFGNATQAETPKPSASTPGFSVGEPIAGDLNAADAWFDKPFTVTDSFPELSHLESFGVAEHDVRLALDGGDLGSVWVGRTEGELCLLISNTVDSSSSATCIKRNKFAIHGIQIGGNGLSARWYGREVFTDSPIAGTSTGSPIKPPMVTGPGDVDAANASFEMPATPQDLFPIDAILGEMSVDQSAVRLGGLDSQGHRVWFVKQGTTGFCLAGYDAGTAEGQYQCVTIEEFKQSGVSLIAPGFAAWWGGNGSTMAGRL